MKSFVGAFGAAFSGKHPGRVFFGSLQREGTCRKRIFAGKIFLHSPAKDVAPIFEARYGDAGNAEMGKGFGIEGLLNLFSTIDSLGGSGLLIVFIKPVLFAA